MAYRNLKIQPKRVNVDHNGETYQLSSEQLQFFNDNGYIVVKKLIHQAALDSYRQRFVDVCNDKIDRKHVTIVKDYDLCKTTSHPEHFINKIQDLMYDEVYGTYPENPRLVHIVSQLIGDQVTAANGMLINKPPGSSLHAPHQDIFYLPFRPAHQTLVAWTAIDPATKQTGCLFMVPGTHKPQKLLDHYHDVELGRQFVFNIQNWETVAPEHKRVYLEMDPGDTVLISTLTVHGSLPNNSKECRKAITCHFANSNCHYTDMDNGNQRLLASLLEETLKPRGCGSYQDMWKMKVKVVKGVKCNL